MDSRNKTERKLSTVDHGVDIIGDEWDEEEDESEMSSMEYEKKFDPAHPYCTNWPVSRKSKNIHSKREV